MKLPPKKSPQSDRLRDTCMRLAETSSRLREESHRIVASTKKPVEEIRPTRRKGMEPYFDHSA
jgi:hypothetical protein